MRKSEISRKTTETDTFVAINLDGTGERSIDSKIGFFNHMLELFAAHGNFDLTVICSGDLVVDYHHSVEDMGIAIGKCIYNALGNKSGIARYGNKSLPMDEALTRVDIDISGRGLLVYNVPPLTKGGKIGDFDCQLIEEFLRAVAINAAITLHVNYVYGTNFHHIAESIIKGFSRALAEAVTVSGKGIPSSKGIID